MSGNKEANKKWCPECACQPCECEIVAQQVHLDEWKDWTPTSENINNLPKPLFRFIHDLETQCDHTGMVRENIQLKEQNEALQFIIKTQRAKLTCSVAMHVILVEAFGENELRQALRGYPFTTRMAFGIEVNR